MTGPCIIPKLSNENLGHLNQSLDVLFSELIKNTDQFPPQEMLEETKQCLEYLSTTFTQYENFPFNGYSWPNDLALLSRRFFQTFKIPEDYIRIIYELCNFTSQIIGFNWLKSDSCFLRLLASLSSGRLLIIMEEPSKIDLSQLIVVLELQEFFYKCVEDGESDLNDDDAYYVAKCCVEAATFTCEYIVESTKETDVLLHIDVFLPIYKYFCAFLSIGGSQTIEKKLLSEALPSLLKVCKFCILQRDFALASPLLSNIGCFHSFPADVLDVALDYFRLHLPVNSNEAIIEICSILDALKDHKGWYTEISLSDAEKMAVAVRDVRLSELVDNIKKAS